MTKSSMIISKEELETKLVQEMAKRGDVPQKYLLKDGFSEAIDDPNIWTNNLLIDLTLLTSSTPSAAGAELAKLRSALTEWGCFLVVNHGMESSFLEEMIEVTKEFFKLPTEEKHKCVGSADNIFQGYGNDRAYRDIPTAANWNDRLFLTLHPKDKLNLQYWPQKPEKIRGMLEEFTKKIRKMNEVIYKAMAKSLNLEEDCFLNQQGKQEEITGKLSFYPICPLPDQVQGHRPHTDGSTMTTILPEKDVQGLEVFKDDQWFKVPVILGALFINIGDLGEVMSNGVFKSAVHRVTANSSKERISVAAFCNPENDNDIRPVNEFIKLNNNNNESQKFRSFSMSEYRATFFDNYVKQRRPIHPFMLY